MKKLISTGITILLLLVYSTSALALEVPIDTTVQNLNGTQQYIKTFTVAPDVYPETLIEESFDFEGYSYSYSYMTKQEKRIENEKLQTDTITVNTDKKDLSVVLAALAPSIEYDDGKYSGLLALDHTTIITEAAGYVSKSYTVSDTKTYDSLISNDMSYIPATAVKNGVTLNLVSVDWQVQSTALVDDILVPSLYRAVASYSAKAWYSAATGYISTADYTGLVTQSGVENITYTLTYIGTQIVSDPNGTKSSGSELADEADGSPIILENSSLWFIILAGALLIAVIALVVYLMRSKRKAAELRFADEGYGIVDDVDYKSTEETE